MNVGLAIEVWGEINNVIITYKHAQVAFYRPENCLQVFFSGRIWHIETSFNREISFLPQRQNSGQKVFKSLAATYIISSFMVMTETDQDEHINIWVLAAVQSGDTVQRDFSE